MLASKVGTAGGVGLAVAGAVGDGAAAASQCVGERQKRSERARSLAGGRTMSAVGWWGRSLLRRFWFALRLNWTPKAERVLVRREMGLARRYALLTTAESKATLTRMVERDRAQRDLELACLHAAMRREREVGRRHAAAARFVFEDASSGKTGGGR